MMSGDPTYWRDVEEAFAATLGVAPAERAGLLDAYCTGHPDMRAEVESLLAAHDDSNGFLEALTLAPMGSDRDDEASEFAIGTVIDKYRLVELIAQGGMGAVYRAERSDGQFVQQVALKITASRLWADETRARFRTERQILASLQQPNIISLLDGGVTADGYPYLVMELVTGTSITEYARTNALGLEARLALMQQVCTAVHYAHRRLVVHRDLKPGNVFVTADGVPKILDFGIAKLLEQPEGAPTVTKTLLGPLTPGYASPEQLRGQTVTTSSDVYSLGVLLFELLAGVRPYETSGLSLDAVLDVVLLKDPPRPSAVATGVPYDAKRLGADLDAIVLKALAKEPEQRYASAEELAADIGRFLAREPVVARSPAVGYLARKLIARNKLAFAVGTASLALLVVALGLAIRSARIANRERGISEARARDTRQLASALLFKIHDAVAPLPGSTPARQTIVTEALSFLERLQRDIGDDVGVRMELARAYRQVGNIQGNPQQANLGDRQGAITSYRKGLALIEPLATVKVPPKDVVFTFTELSGGLGLTLVRTGDRTDAVAAVRRGREVAEQYLVSRPDDAEAMGVAARSNFTEAQVLPLKDSLPAWQRSGRLYDQLLALKPDDPSAQRNVALVEKYVGAYYEELKDYPQTLSHYRRAVELDEKRAARQPDQVQTQLDVAIDYGNIAHIQQISGHLTEAVAGFERSLQIRQKVVDLDPRNDFARGRLAFAHDRLGMAYAEALDHTRAAANLQAAVTLLEGLADRDIGFKRDLAVTEEHVAKLEQARKRSAAACAASVRSRALFSEVGTKVTLNAGETASRDEATARATACTARARRP